MVKNNTNTGFLAIIILLLLSAFPNLAFANDADSYDLVIKNGTIYNPATGHILENYHIGINDSTIESITRDSIVGEQEIDASGQVVSPGFIDLISYDPNAVGIELKVLDGVTSNLAMHGGTEDATSWYANWGNNDVLTNFGASSFITRQRWPIIGAGIDTEMTEEADIQQLVDDVRANVEAGALGISFSLEYVPGVKHELIPLLELANEYDLPTFYHLRYSDEERGLEGIQEVIDAGNETGAIIHIMHINSTGGTFVMDEALAMVDEAKASGLDITTDFYPYDFWATYLGSARFRPGWQDRFKIGYEDLQIGGTDTRITEETFAQYRGENPLVAALGSMPESELEMLLKHPDTMVGSDTIIEPHHNNHPRGAGAFSRLFGKYVREEQTLSMMDAIKKVSYFPAKRMETSAPAMKNKGKIEIGADADITIFNPETITDKSTVKDTAAPSEGIEYVLINGVVTKDQDGIVPGIAAGEPIMSYFVDETPDITPVDFKVTLDDGEPVALEHVYMIHDQAYFSINEIMPALDVVVNDTKDGEFEIKDIATLQIGDRQAYVGDTEIELTEVPVLYQEDVFLSMNTLQQIMEETFEINESDDQLEMTRLFTDEEEESNSNQDTTNENSDKDIKTDQDNFINYLIYAAIALTIIIILVVMFTPARKKKRKR